MKYYPPCAILGPDLLVSIRGPLICGSGELSVCGLVASVDWGCVEVSSQRCITVRSFSEGEVSLGLIGFWNYRSVIRNGYCVKTVRSLTLETATQSSGDHVSRVRGQK